MLSRFSKVFGFYLGFCFLPVLFEAALTGKGYSSKLPVKCRCWEKCSPSTWRAGLMDQEILEISMQPVCLGKATVVHGLLPRHYET